MTRIIRRAYTGEKDLQSIAALLAAVRGPDLLEQYPAAGDLEELLSLQRVRDNTRLWWNTDDGLSAFALVDHYHNLWFETKRDDTAAEIEREIIDWGVRCIQKEITQSGEESTLDASCRDDDTRRIALLEERGFIRQEITTIHLARSLMDPLPAPQPPEGFTMRPAAGEGEVEALVRLHRSAFGTENMTVEERLAMMRAQDYDRQLDLLVTAPDGRMAAYCLCSFDRVRDNKRGGVQGAIDTIATHPDFQGLGLAKALLLAGMMKLKQRGADRAVMSTSSENSAMQRTAFSVGYSVQSKTLWYSLPVSAG